MKARPSLPGLLSLVPFLGFLWLMLYSYVAYLQGGHWPPVYGRPDPTSLRPWGVGHALMGILIVFMFASSLALPLMLCVSARRALRASHNRIRGWAVLVRQASVFTLGAVLFVTELLRSREWLLD